MPPPGRRRRAAASRRFPVRRSGALLQDGRVPGHRERAQQEGIQDQAGVVFLLDQRPQPADEQQQLP